MPEWVCNYRSDTKWRDYASNPPDVHQTQIMLLVVENHQWPERTILCLNMEPGKLVHLPIMA